ncbi:MAG: cation-translocating P-type ATPase [Cyclobacteriaceae bacterium]|nr:cation-translocating P-type ATPase [Cyclobacteriaceae bacterium]
MPDNPFSVNGLNTEQVEASRKQNGRNTIHNQQKNHFWPSLKEILTEPMFLLLVAASVIYFVLGETGEAVFMLVAIVLVSTISFYQDSRSRKALAALKEYTRAQARVIRNGIVENIPSEDIVLGDFVVAEEGTLLAADGEIIQGNDFSVNESILTGEAFSISKDLSDPKNKTVYQGTTVVSGLAVYRVTSIGKQTQLGKIGASLEEIKEEKTPLQLQIGNFVKKMALVGAVVFLLVWGANFYQSRHLLESLLKGLTLAMSILPEEIPVAFTTFMALGAWRLMRAGIIVKQTKTVETLGSATVICTDKTGTITENRMELAKIYVHENKTMVSKSEWRTPESKRLLTTAMWASEPVPFDPMEKELHRIYEEITTHDERPEYHMRHEYPLSGKPPMMTHIFENSAGGRIIACKGAPESLLKFSNLSLGEQEEIQRQVTGLSHEGYRVLGVAESVFESDNFPKGQHEFSFTFLGLVAFYDPPKANISDVFQQFYNAGIQVKIITGDNALTTSAIARMGNFIGADKTLDGEELIGMTDEVLAEKVNSVNIFTRMFPEAKLRIINALKLHHHIVAMTGDGVNDGPALKAAHIGIAMGKRGSEIAKHASALILTDDDLEKMITAIAMGRKIYSNLKKAIQYIISIHIPIILTVALPLLLGWVYPNIFTPLHVIFLELIMGPTCSIIYENEPLEKNSMLQPPRVISHTFLTWRELWISVLQGLMITVGILFSYQYAVHHGADEVTTRSLVFATLVLANIFLTLVNRSFYYSVLTAFAYKNWMIPLVVLITIILLALLLYVPVVSHFFQLTALSVQEVAVALTIALCSVVWFELFKLFKRRNHKVA